MADTPDLGSGAERLAGSSPASINMLYVIRFPASTGRDVILKHFNSKPAARGFLTRLNRLLESEDAYLDEIEETERCGQCKMSMTFLIRGHKVHECEV